MKNKTISLTTVISIKQKNTCYFYFILSYVNNYSIQVETEGKEQLNILIFCLFMFYTIVRYLKHKKTKPTNILLRFQEIGTKDCRIGCY